MRSVYEQKIINAFLDEYSKNGNNPVWACETLNYKIFVEHYYEFENLPEETKWEIRNLMGALKKIYQ